MFPSKLKTIGEYAFAVVTKIKTFFFSKNTKK